ncbi:hypothetical protein [Priestia sp. P5]|uniref:hypothetical protein n=1 Tax=Priestia sp. P5 TaxID=2917806 RepID=UPI0024070B88|nr:hypothetical protein [Priestia sp. P5]MDG0058873.1 hypothetical protein [Priestia sp. P5]
MIGGKGEDSCGKSGIDETPQERKRRGGSSAARGKQQPFTEITSSVTKRPILDHLLDLFIFRLY